MSGPARDEEFEAFLRERAALPGHLGGAEPIEPPEELDHLVLSKARQAIHAPSPLPLYRTPRWGLPVALAATILLSLSIVLNLSLSTRKRETLATNTSADSVQQTFASGRSARALKEAPIPPAAAPSAPSMAAPSMAAPSMTAPPPAAPSMAAPDAQSLQAPQDAQLPAAPNMAGAPASLAGARAAERPGSSSVAEESAAPMRDPAAWLRRIEALRAQGRKAQAAEEWRRFRLAFPDYPVKTDPAAGTGPVR